MNIRIKDGTPKEVVESIMTGAFEDSRFNVKVTASSGRRAAGFVKLLNARLKKAKEYCGNHAKACENAHIEHHARRRYLEGRIGWSSTIWSTTRWISTVSKPRWIP